MISSLFIGITILWSLVPLVVSNENDEAAFAAVASMKSEERRGQMLHVSINDLLHHPNKSHIIDQLRNVYAPKNIGTFVISNNQNRSDDDVNAKVIEWRSLLRDTLYFNIEDTNPHIPFVAIDDIYSNNLQDTLSVPRPIAMAATFNTDLIHKLGQHVAQNYVASGFSMIFSPNVNDFNNLMITSAFFAGIQSVQGISLCAKGSSVSVLKPLTSLVRCLTISDAATESEITELRNNGFSGLIFAPEFVLGVDNLSENNSNNNITTEYYKTSAERILSLKLLSSSGGGGFYNREKLPGEEFVSQVKSVEKLETARRIASESIVLLKNTDNVLPLSGNSSINIVSKNCSKFYDMMVKSVNVTCQRKRISTGINIAFYKDAGSISSYFNKGALTNTVLIATDRKHLGDQALLKSSIAILYHEMELIREVHEEEDEDLFYDYQALIDTILGLDNPSGRLPFSIEGGFSFGTGLSYTKFSYSDVELSETDNTLTLTVANTGSKLSGTETVLVFLQETSANKELLGFTKVQELQPLESRNVTVSLSSSSNSKKFVLRQPMSSTTTTEEEEAEVQPPFIVVLLGNMTEYRLTVDLVI